MTSTCPCCSGLAYAVCCGPWHRGGNAPTAEALMRSRYAAFVHKDAAYLSRTCHPTLRGGMNLRDLRASFALTWTSLEILATRSGGPADDEGMVHFRANFQGGSHEERSRFVRRQGEWLYRDGKG